MANIFLSYARNDDEAFVRRFYEHLCSAGFSVWFDRVSMPSRSLTFLQEIRDEIHSCQQLILVIGPTAIASDYVKAEWHHALAEAKVVIPVLRKGQYEGLPPELDKFHCPDARESQTKTENDFYAEIKRILQEPIPPLAMVVGGAPDLPPHFQPRPEELTTIAGNVFFDLENPVDLQPSEKVIIIHGMGGVGKTVLAAAFARYTSARRVFKDGIYWLSSTLEMSQLSICNRLGMVISGSPQSWNDIPEAVTHLKMLLNGKRSLIVLDNIWKVEQVEPILNCLDLNTRVLLTTRDAGLIAAIGGRGINIPELSKTAAMRQLADWMHKKVEEMPDIANELAKECGYLPFALALNGAMLAEGYKLEDLLDALRSAEIDFAEKRFANYAYPTVLKSIKVSIDALAPSDYTAVERFRDLAVYNWENGVPCVTVELFWRHNAGMSDRSSRKMLSILENKSLLRMTGKSGGTRIFLHDLMIDYLRLTTDDPVALNKKLLETYQKECPSDWPAGPADGYFHQNLVTHLLKDGQVNEVHRLFSIETSEGLNAWYIANDATDNIGGFLDDTDKILNASQLIAAAPGTRIKNEIRFQIRYGLIRASLRSLAEKLPSGFRTALLRTGAWNGYRAVAEANQVPGILKRFNALLELIPYLTDPFRYKAVSDAISLAREYKGNDANPLAQIIPFLDESEKETIIEEARSFVYTIDSPGYRAKAFAIIIPVLSEAKRREFIPLALELLETEISSAEENQGGFDSVSILAPYVNRDEMSVLLDLARRIPNDFCRAIALTQVIGHTDPEHREELAREGLQLQSQIQGNSDWIHIAFVRYLPETSFESLFDEIVKKDDRQAGYLLTLLPKSLGAVEGEKWIDRITDLSFRREIDRTDAYISLISRLPEISRAKLVERLCLTIPELEYPSWKSEAFQSLAPWLTKDQLVMAKLILSVISDQYHIAKALISLVDLLDEKSKKPVYDFFISSINPSLHLDLYIYLAQRSQHENKWTLLVDAYEAFKRGASIGDGVSSEDRWIEVLSVFADMGHPFWKPEIVNTALNRIFSRNVCAEVLSTQFVIIIRQLSPDQVEYGVNLILNKAIKETENKKNQVSWDTTIGDDRCIPNIIGILAPFLNESLVNQCIEILQNSTNYDLRIISLIYLLPYIPVQESEKFVKEAFKAQQQFELTISDSRLSYCKPLVMLSDMLEGKEKEEVLSKAMIAAEAIIESGRFDHLISVAKRLDIEKRTGPLLKASWIARCWEIYEVLELLPPEANIEFAEKNILEDFRYYNFSLDKVLPIYASRKSREAQYNLWKKMHAILSSFNREEMVKRLANSTSLLYSLGGHEVINELNQSLLKVCQWWK